MRVKELGSLDHHGVFEVFKDSVVLSDSTHHAAEIDFHSTKSDRHRREFILGDIRSWSNDGLSFAARYEHMYADPDDPEMLEFGTVVQSESGGLQIVTGSLDLNNRARVLVAHNFMSLIRDDRVTVYRFVVRGARYERYCTLKTVHHCWLRDSKRILSIEKDGSLLALDSSNTIWRLRGKKKEKVVSLMCRKISAEYSYFTFGYFIVERGYNYISIWSYDGRKVFEQSDADFCLNARQDTVILKEDDTTLKIINILDGRETVFRADRPIDEFAGSDIGGRLLVSYYDKDFFGDQVVCCNLETHEQFDLTEKVKAFSTNTAKPVISRLYTGSTDNTFLLSVGQAHGFQKVLMLDLNTL